MERLDVGLKDDTHLDTFDISTYLIAITIGRPVKEIFYDCVLVVELSQRISHYWNLQRSLEGKSMLAYAVIPFTRGTYFAQRTNQPKSS